MKQEGSVKDLAEFAMSAYLLLLGGTFFAAFSVFKIYLFLALGSVITFPGTVFFIIWTSSFDQTLLPTSENKFIFLFDTSVLLFTLSIAPLEVIDPESAFYQRLVAIAFSLYFLLPLYTSLNSFLRRLPQINHRRAIGPLFHVFTLIVAYAGALSAEVQAWVALFIATPVVMLLFPISIFGNWFFTELMELMR